MRSRRRRFACVGAGWLVILAGLAGCVTNSNDEGRVTVAVKDAPSDGFRAVVVAFSNAEVGRADASDSWIKVNRDLAVVDLKSYTGDARSSIGGASVSPGEYGFLRLAIDRAHGVWPNATEHDFALPSREVTLQHPWAVKAGSTTALTIDFDLMASVREVGPGQYEFRPTMTLIIETGDVTTTVDVGQGDQVTEGQKN